MNPVYRRNFLQLIGAVPFAGVSTRVLAAAPQKVVVIGAGIMGASIAYHLAKRGAQVTVLDKEGPATGTTKNSFAWLNSGGKSPRSYYDLNLAGLLGWRRLELEIGSELPMQWGGGIAWGPATPEQITAKRAKLVERQGWGYPVYEVTAADITRMAPGVVPGAVGYAQYCDIEGTVDPVAAANVLINKAKAFGATVVYPCEITALDLGADKIKGVKTTKGAFEADTVVIAAGNGTPPIAQMAGFTVPLIESRGILAHTKPHARIIDRVLMAPKGNIKQHLDGRLVTGEDFGDSGDQQLSPELAAKHLKTMAEYVPAAADAEIEFMTLGHRVMPKDGHPIIDRAPKYANLFVAAQHSGMTCAPVVGQMMAIEVLDQVRTEMLAPYRLARFTA